MIINMTSALTYTYGLHEGKILFLEPDMYRFEK